MCFRIGIFWFVFNVLASFLAYGIYSFNRRARALFRGVHYVITPKKDVILWNMTFIFSGYYKKFSIVLLQIHGVPKVRFSNFMRL